MDQPLLKIVLLVLCACLTMRCQDPRSQAEQERILGGIGAFSEMIQSGVKQLALSSPLAPPEMDRLLPKARAVAEQYDVQIFRESDLLVTDLFPADVAEGKDVLLLYRGHTLAAYQQLKADKARLIEADEYVGDARTSIARRFGRLLSYTPRRINDLLRDNTAYRTMSDFGVRATNVFLYYRDLSRATHFYQQVLGLELIADYQMATIFRVAEASYIILVDADKGMHSADEPKTVALALITDQLDAWYDYLGEVGVPIKYDLKVRPESAHDGFVAIDPEGYLLEFERFNQHPENERFIPVLDQAETIPAQNDAGSLPDELGFKSTITWLYYRDVLAMQGFHEEVLGLELVADQGWAKIYQASSTGFVGLVDERRGMHQFTQEKGVTVSYFIDDLDGWFDYVQAHEILPLREEEIGAGPEGKYRAFVGYDPENYFLEFDRFYEHADNVELLPFLQDSIRP